MKEYHELFDEIEPLDRDIVRALSSLKEDRVEDIRSLHTSLFCQRRTKERWNLNAFHLRTPARE